MIFPLYHYMSHREAIMDTQMVEITTKSEGKKSIVNVDCSLMQYSIVLTFAKISLFKTFLTRG